MGPAVKQCARALVGQSPAMASVRRMIQKAARNRLPVLLLGETGTGKEVVARAIHDAAPQGQFVAIDCGSLVGTLMESELFGHVRGSFSGASENKRGLVELAHGGTAFFDEIGDLPLEMQIKLLRLIQEREFRPVGALNWHKIDLRIIAATHRNLQAEVAAGHFRQDLYYRLHVLVIHLPPLREHKEDIPPLLGHFIDLARAEGLPEFCAGDDIMRALLSYDWPGNIRELKHCVDRMAALHSDGVLQLADLPSALRSHLGARALEDAASVPPRHAFAEFVRGPVSPLMSVPECEKAAIGRALAETHGARSRAARILKIGRTTLYRKMKQYGFE